MDSVKYIMGDIDFKIQAKLTDMKHYLDLSNISLEIALNHNSSKLNDQTMTRRQNQNRKDQVMRLAINVQDRFFVILQKLLTHFSIEPYYTR